MTPFLILPRVKCWKNSAHWLHSEIVSAPDEIKTLATAIVHISIRKSFMLGGQAQIL
jgi:hypothetical protein